MPNLDIYWSFRSPYSYMATGRLLQISRDYEVTARFRPVRPIMMREDDFLQQHRPQFLGYFMKDIVREAARLGMPLQWPQPDPVVMDFETRKAAPEQPYMDRLLGLGVAAEELGKGLEFADCAARRIWSGEPNWDQGTVLAEAASEAGLSLEALEIWASENKDQVWSAVEKNEADHIAHHWGVPLMVLDDEAFFGQDRLDALYWRLDQLKLKKPT